MYLLWKTNIIEYEKYNNFSFKIQFIPKIITILGDKKGENEAKTLVIPDVHLKDWMFESIVLSKLSELRRAILSEDLIKYMHKMNYHVWTLKPRFSGVVIYPLSLYPWFCIR